MSAPNTSQLSDEAAPPIKESFSRMLGLFVRGSRGSIYSESTSSSLSGEVFLPESGSVESVKIVARRRQLFECLPDGIVLKICELLDVANALKVQCLCKATMRALPIKRFSFDLPGVQPFDEGTRPNVSKVFKHIIIDHRWAAMPQEQHKKLLKYLSELETIRVHKSFYEQKLAAMVPSADHFTSSLLQRVEYNATDHQSNTADADEEVPVVLGGDRNGTPRSRDDIDLQSFDPTLQSVSQATPVRTTGLRPFEDDVVVYRRSRSEGRLYTCNRGECQWQRNRCSSFEEIDYEAQFLQSGVSLDRYHRRPIPCPITASGSTVTSFCNPRPFLIDMSSNLDDSTPVSIRQEDRRSCVSAARSGFGFHESISASEPRPLRQFPYSASPRFARRTGLNISETAEPSTIPDEVQLDAPQDLTTSPLQAAEGVIVPRPPVRADESRAKKVKAFEDFCSILEICVQARRTLQTFKCSSVPEDASFVLDADSAIPELPVRFVKDPDAVDSHKPLEFSSLRKLIFGKTIDCRHIVPLVDFCVFPHLYSLQIGVISLSYSHLKPRFGFGRSPTVVLAPQLVFHGPDCDDSTSESDVMGDDSGVMAAVRPLRHSPETLALPAPEEDTSHAVVERESREGAGVASADAAIVEGVETGETAENALAEGRADNNETGHNAAEVTEAVDERMERSERERLLQPFSSPHLPAIYNGALDEGLRFEGPGVYCSHHYLYEGTFEEGLNCGYGVMTSRDGERYEGNWLRGRRHGRGKVIQADERVLDGDWWYDAFEGRGTMTTPAGLRYHGEWRHHTWDGWGVLSLMGRVIVFGEFMGGLLNGWNRAIGPDGTTWVDGKFVMGVLVDEIKGSMDDTVQDVQQKTDPIASGGEITSSGATSPPIIDRVEARNDFISSHIRDTLEHLRKRVARRAPISTPLDPRVVDVSQAWKNMDVPEWLIESTLQCMQFDV